MVKTCGPAILRMSGTPQIICTLSSVRGDRARLNNYFLKVYHSPEAGTQMGGFNELFRVVVDNLLIVAIVLGVFGLWLAKR